MEATTTKFDTMGKEALRAECRAAGISYAKLAGNSGMRAALVAHYAPKFEETVTAIAQEEIHFGDAVVAANNPFAALMGVVKAPVTPAAGVQFVDGKKVEPDAPVETSEKQRKTPKVKTVAPVLEKVSCKGRKIQKEREVRNGIKRPSVGTRCSEIWDYYDANPTTAAGDLNGIADDKLWDRTTMHVQFYVWRRFNGITRNAK